MATERQLGSDCTFEEFYEREHAVQVRRAALLLRSPDEAHDVVHDAMVDVYRRWETIDRPVAYLTRAVVNGCNNSFRRADSRRRALNRVRPLESVSAPADPLGDLFDALPFNQRAAVVLGELGEHSVALSLEGVALQFLQNAYRCLVQVPLRAELTTP